MDEANRSIGTEDFLKDMLYILRETFEGSPSGEGSVYLDSGVGLFSTIGNLSAGTVSSEQKGATIVAHTEHLKFYLDRLCEFIEGRRTNVNWEQSWLIDNVDEQEWDVLKNGVKKSYENVLRCFASVKAWDQTNIGEAISIIAHTAYHLGAIRQLVKFAKADQD